MRRHAFGLWPSIAAATIAVVLRASPSPATIVMQLTTPEMTALSDLVVRADVVSQASGWTDDHRQMVTLTRLRIAEYVKGAGPTELLLRQFGGAIGNVHSRVAGDAALQVGMQYVLFLRQGNGVVFLTALAQSAYEISTAPGTTPTVQRDLHDLTFARRESGSISIVGPATASASVESLEHLVASVRASTRGAR